MTGFETTFDGREAAMARHHIVYPATGPADDPPMIPLLGRSEIGPV